MTPDPNAPVRQQSWWNRNWKWVVPVGCLLPLLCCGTFGAVTYFGVSQVIGNSQVFLTALGKAAENKDVQATLGAPLKPGLGMSGSLNESNGNGDANFSVPIEGPKGKGTLRVVATSRSAGQWTYSVMEVEAGGKTIDLLAGGGADEDPPPPDDELPPVDDSPEPEPADPED